MYPMELTKIKAYTAIWLSIPFIVFLSLLSSNTPVDFTYHDIFFVVEILHLSLLFSLLLAFLGLVYWWMRNRPLVYWMKLVHVGVTIGVFTTFLLTHLVKNKLYALGFSTHREINFSFYILILVFIGIQLLFVANIYIGLVGRKGV